MRTRIALGTSLVGLLASAAVYFYVKGKPGHSPLASSDAGQSAADIGRSPGVAIFEYSLRSDASSTVSMTLTGQATKKENSSISITMESQGRLLMARQGKAWSLQFAPAKLLMKNGQGEAYAVEPLLTELSQATIFWQPGEDPVLESDRPLQASTMGIVLQFVANLGPGANPIESQTKIWGVRDLQKQCIWSFTPKAKDGISFGLQKSQCKSIMSDDLTIELIESQGEGQYQADGEDLESLSYSENSKAYHSTGFLSQNRTSLTLARSSDGRNFWRQPGDQRIPISSKSAFAALPKAAASEHPPVSLDEIQELAVRARSNSLTDDRAATERKFVHFARQHPDQVRKLLDLVEGLDSKNQLFRMVVVALAEGRNTASQDNLIQLIENRLQDQAATELLFGAVAQMLEPNEALLAFTRETFQKSPPGSTRNISGMALGGILQHMRDSHRDRIQAIVSELNQSFASAGTEEDKVLILSILGNAGVDESLPVLLPHVQDSQSTLHSFAIQSLRFLRDDKSYALLLEQLARPDVASRRSALMALDFRVMSQELAESLKRMILNSGEEMGVRLMALEVMGRKQTQSEIARASLMQIPRERLSAKLQKRYDDIMRSQ